MKKIEREMKGDESNVTDDEVCPSTVVECSILTISRTTFLLLHIPMSHTTMPMIVLVPNLPLGVELTSRLTKNSKMTQDEHDSIKQGLPSSRKMMMQMILLKKPQAASQGTLDQIVQMLFCITTLPAWPMLQSQLRRRLRLFRMSMLHYS